MTPFDIVIYECDCGYNWTIKRQRKGVFNPGEDVCPQCGEEAVTYIGGDFLDYAEIVLKPSIYSDGINTARNGYFIALQDRSGKHLVESTRIFTWEEAIKKIEIFKDLKTEDALVRWKKFKKTFEPELFRGFMGTPFDLIGDQENNK